MCLLLSLFPTLLLSPSLSTNQSWKSFKRFVKLSHLICLSLIRLSRTLNRHTQTKNRYIYTYICVCLCVYMDYISPALGILAYPCACILFWHFAAQNDFMWSGDYFHLNCVSPQSPPLALAHPPLALRHCLARLERLQLQRQRIFMGIERVPPPCALFPPSSSLPFFRLLSAVFAAAFCCLWPLLAAIASMAPFVFMSSSINPCLREACYPLPPSPFSPSPFLSLSLLHLHLHVKA